MNRYGNFAQKRRAANGYALVAVLWSLALLSIIAAALIFHSRLSARIESNAWERLRTEMAAQAAVSLGVMALFDPRTHSARGLDGAPFPFAFGGVEGEISIQDEFGKADLNAADADLLRALLQAAGLSPPDAEIMTQRILDWRGAGPRRQAVAAQAYNEAGLPYEPRGAPFQSVNELRLVMGMTDALFERLQPVITIHSQSGAIDPKTAPELVLRAMPGFEAQTIDDRLSERRRRAADPSQPSVRVQGVIRVPLNGRAFTITVQIVQGKRLFHEETVVRLTGDPRRPFWILEVRKAAPPHRG